MLEKCGIRKANMKEFSCIRKLFEDVKEDLKKREIVMWADRYPLDVLEDDIKTDSMYVLIDKKNNIVGCFTLLKEDNLYKNIKWELCGNSLYIERVVINPKMQGHGLSNKIMEFIITHAKENEYEIIRLTVLEANMRAYLLYKKYNFSEVDKGSHMTRSGRIAIATERKTRV